MTEHATARTANASKLHGRAFYESLGSPKLILAPMVDQSEFAWRMLTRSFVSDPKDLLAYTPMLHARMFAQTSKFRNAHFQATRTPLETPLDDTVSLADLEPHLDGNPRFDRPLIVQFCANDPDELLEAAKYVAPFCDAVDLNLGCPQGIAKRGHYGAFLQEDWGLIYNLINKLHAELSVPITAKMRVLESKEKTLAYAKTILDAGASWICVHARTRDMKGHATGLADYSYISYLRERLPRETVIFANGNILQHGDIRKCLEETGADGVMSAEANLYDPAVFAPEPRAGEFEREFFRGKDGRNGWRMDAVLRRYMDIVHKYVLEQDPPPRKPLFITSDSPHCGVAEDALENSHGKRERHGQAAAAAVVAAEEDEAPCKKRQKGDKKEKSANPNLASMQAHLFHMLRPLVAKHTHVRDALARCRAGDMAAYEKVLGMVEDAVKQGLTEYEAGIDDDGTECVPRSGEGGDDAAVTATERETADRSGDANAPTSSAAAVARCKRAWWVCQPHVRPLPAEALAKGSLQLSKKERKRQDEERWALARRAGLRHPDGTVRRECARSDDGTRKVDADVAGEGLVCG